MNGWAANGNASGSRGSVGGLQDLWGAGGRGEEPGRFVGGEGVAAGGGGSLGRGYGGDQGQGHDTSSFGSPPPPSSSSKHASHETLYSLMQQGVISQAQFDVLVVVPTPAGTATLGGTQGGRREGGQQHQQPPTPTQQQYAPPPATPNSFTPPTAPSNRALSPLPTSASLYHPYQQSRPPPPPPQPYQPSPPLQQQPQQPPPPITPQAIQSHLVAIDQIQAWQQRLRMLQDSLQSGVYPPGVASAQPIGQTHRESMEREVGELKSRQSSLVNQCQSFIARSGGLERVTAQVRAFRSRVPPLATSPPSLPLAAPLPSIPLRPPSTCFTPTPSYTPSTPVVPSPQVPPLYRPPSAASNLTIGPQAQHASRSQAARSMPPTTFPPSRPSSVAGSPATTVRPLAGLPKPDEGPKRKSATQILLEGKPGMPSLAQLQAKLTASAFKDSFANVLGKKGIPLQDFWVENRIVSLYDLYQTVMVAGGGGEKVTTDKSWSRIANLLSFTIASAQRLAEIYRTVLTPYEEVWSEMLLRQHEKLLAERKEAANGAGRSGEKSRGTSTKVEDDSTMRSPGSSGVEPPKSTSPIAEKSWGSSGAAKTQQQILAIGLSGLGGLPSQHQASATASRFASSQHYSHDTLPTPFQSSTATPVPDFSNSTPAWRSPAPPTVELPTRRADVLEVLAEGRRLKESVNARKARDAASSQPRAPSSQRQHSVPSHSLPLHPALGPSHAFTPPTPTVGLSDLFALTSTGHQQLSDSGQFDELVEPPTKLRRMGGLGQTVVAHSPAESATSLTKAEEAGTGNAKKRARGEQVEKEEVGTGSEDVSPPMSFADALGASQREARPFDFARIPSFAPAFAPIPPPSSEVRNFDPFPISVTPSSATPSFDPFLSFSPSHLSPSHSTVETPELADQTTGNELSPPSDEGSDRALSNLSTFEEFDPMGGFGPPSGLDDGWGRRGETGKWGEEARLGPGGEFGDGGAYGNGRGFAGDAFGFEEGRYAWGS